MPVSVCQLLYCTTVLFKVLYCKIKNVFCVFYYLCEKYYKPITVQQYIASCVSWVSAATAKSLQSCPTLCDPIDGSPPGSPIPGILQARTLEWVANSFSNAWKWKEKGKSLSRVWLLATPWTAAHQAPPSMGFSRLENPGWGAIAFSKLST